MRTERLKIERLTIDTDVYQLQIAVNNSGSTTSYPDLHKYDSKRNDIALESKVYTCDSVYRLPLQPAYIDLSRNIHV